MYAPNLAFLLQFLGCHRSSFFHFRALHHWDVSMMDPGWIPGPWFISFCPHLCKSEGPASDEWGQCVKCRECFTQELHCQENTLTRAALWRIPGWQAGQLNIWSEKTKIWAEPAPLSHAWFGAPWAGLAEEDALSSIPSSVLSSKPFKQSSSDRQLLLNYHPNLSSGGQTTLLVTCCSFDKILQK